MNPSIFSYLMNIINELFSKLENVVFLNILCWYQNSELIVN